MKSISLIFLFVAVTCALLGADSARACSVPVFRYALERWEADPYDVVVFYRGRLTEEDQALVDGLTEAATGGEAAVNLDVRAVDVSKEFASADLERLWKSQQSPELPWMVVRTPYTARNDAVIWQGRPAGEAIDALVDSPARREIARRILEGHSVVWLLLESGDKAFDDAAETSLTTRLKQLERILELPPSPADMAAESGIDPAFFGYTESLDIASTIPLEVKFSLLRMSREDAAEEMFARQLIACEADLKDYLGEPMAFPIYGRGRALYGLVGRGINARNIEEASLFLIGACSCVVKASNPGADLLMAVNWDNALFGDMMAGPPPAPPPLTGLGPVRPLPKTEATDERDRGGKPDNGDAPFRDSHTTDDPSDTNPPTPQPVAGLTAKRAEENPGPKGGGRLDRNVLIVFALLGGGVATGALFLTLRGKV